VKSRNQSHEKQQLLSSIEENELAVWISNDSRLGVPTPLPLVENLAEEIRSERFASRGNSLGRPISTRWIDRFRVRHPELETCVTRPIDASHFEGLEYSKVKSYYDGLGEAIRREQHPCSAIFNVDETGLALVLLGNRSYFSIRSIRSAGRSRSDAKSGLRRSSAFLPRG
jgi:hypothetical protein